MNSMILSYRHSNRSDRQQLDVSKQFRLRNPLECLLEPFLSILLGIVLVDPILPRKGNALGVLGHLLPVCLVPPVARGLAGLLYNSNTFVPGVWR